MAYLLPLLILLAVFCFSIISKKIEVSYLTLPMFFTALGFSIQYFVPDIANAYKNNEYILLLAELTLILVLFSDAARVNITILKQTILIPTRMLLIGLPLTIALGTFFAYLVSPNEPWALALLLAAILAPTDAALGQSLISNENVPESLRVTINVESGLNDGFAVPVVTVAAILTAQAYGTMHMADENLVAFTLKQIFLAPVAGVLIGAVGGIILLKAKASGYIATPHKALVFLSLALGAYFFASLIGGNGFIAAFVAGLAFGYVSKKHDRDVYTFMESQGELLTIISFMTFGAILLPIGLAHATMNTFLLAIAFLTVVRILPIWISLIGTKLPFSHKLTLGWFGPRGLASILFSIIILEHYDIPHVDELLACIVLTVVMSIILHGLSAKPIVDMFKRSKNK